MRVREGEAPAEPQQVTKTSAQRELRPPKSRTPSIHSVPVSRHERNEFYENRHARLRDLIQWVEHTNYVRVPVNQLCPDKTRPIPDCLASGACRSGFRNHTVLLSRTDRDPFVSIMAIVRLSGWSNSRKHCRKPSFITLPATIRFPTRLISGLAQ